MDVEEDELMQFEDIETESNTALGDNSSSYCNSDVKSEATKSEDDGALDKVEAKFDKVENYEDKNIEVDTKSPTNAEVISDAEDDTWKVVSYKNNKGKNESTNSVPKMKKVSILDKLCNEISIQKVTNVDPIKANRALQYLQMKWDNWVFAKVMHIKAQGQPHIVYVNKKENSETYLKNMTDYEAMCKKDKEETGEDNMRKSTKIYWERGFYGWARLFNGDIVYIHHTNYAQPDFGIGWGDNRSACLKAQFMMSMKGCVKTPKVGDYICLIAGHSTKVPGKLEGAPWFVCSYTLYRTINIVKYGKNMSMFRGERKEARLIASMITNGNELVRGDDCNKIMTPINCEDIALREHYVYATIVMVCVLHLKFQDHNFWKLPMVGNLDYTDFILNIGDVDELLYINANPPMYPHSFISFILFILLMHSKVKSSVLSKVPFIKSYLGIIINKSDFCSVIFLESLL